MRTQFRDRREAGARLAAKLASFAEKPDVLVLALPRGGVPVAAEVAKKLHAPLDVFVVRKLGLPGYAELAMGAIAHGGMRVLNREVVDSLRISGNVIASVTAQEERELERRERSYRGNQPPLDVRGKTVVVVDDGVATGSTMMAAVTALRQLEVARIIVAAPVVAATTFSELSDAADEVAALCVPDDFGGVGQWYEDFSQTTDAEVHRLLGEQGNVPPPPDLFKPN